MSLVAIAALTNTVSIAILFSKSWIFFPETKRLFEIGSIISLTFIHKVNQFILFFKL
jgi:hypothetical protein